VIRALLDRNLRHHARLLLSLFGGFIVLEMLICWIASSIEAGPGLASLWEQMMPSAFRRMFSAQMGMASFDGMVAFGFRHPAILTAAVAYVIVVGTLPAGERESGLLDLILARPVRRSRYLTAVVLALAIGALVLPVALLIGTVAVLPLLDVSSALPWQRYVPSAASLAALLLAIGGYSLLIAVTSRRRGPAVARAVGLTIVLFFLEFLASAWEAVSVLRWLTPFHYHQPIRAAVFREMPLVNPLTLLLLFAVCTMAAYACFRRQDL
jgi:ABC-2 type transport system permease protein